MSTLRPACTWVLLLPSFALGADQRAAVGTTEYDSQLRLLDEQIRRNPQHAPEYYERGVFWHSRQNYDRAIRDFTEAFRLDPKHGYALVARSYAWLGNNELDRARDDLDAAIRLDAERYTAHCRRGYAYLFARRGDASLRAHRYHEAIKHFDTAIDFGSNASDVLVGRGYCRVMKKEFDRALADYDEAIRLEPENAEGYYFRAFAKKAKKDLDQAITDFDTAIRLNPRRPHFFKSRGFVWAEKKDFARALKDHEEALRLDPRYPDSLCALAWLCATCPDAKFRDAARSLELAKRSCELTEWKKPCFLGTLAAAYAEAGRFDEAVRYVEQALADTEYQVEFGDTGRKMLRQFQEKKPYRDE